MSNDNKEQPKMTAWCEPHFPDNAHSQLLTFRA
jgi:hypothetical protein